MLRSFLPIAAFALAACSTGETPPPGDVEPSPSDEHYEARGNEPGWQLTIDKGWIYYVGNYGEKRISAPRPDPRPSFNGRRYVTDRLTVDLTYSRCNDDMSGHGYEHQVMVTADGETFRGCGGARRTDWDM
jgi:heat shock protein HslJ